MTSRLQSVGPKLWIADGSPVSFYGFPYPTRMAVAALPEGLWIWSPIEPDDDLVREIRAIGEVRWLVEPNRLHHLFLTPWLERFPEARALAPPGLRRKRPDVAFSGELGETPDAAWAGEIDQAVIGNRAFSEVFFFHRPSSTCLVCDFVQRQDPGVYSGWQRRLMRLDGLSGPQGSTPRELRTLLLRRGPARRALAKAVGWNAEQLVIAHGACALEDGTAVLKRALSWVGRPWPA